MTFQPAEHLPKLSDSNRKAFKYKAIFIYKGIDTFIYYFLLIYKRYRFDFKFDFMKLLGKSLHIANSGKLIARSTKTPSPGAAVFDSNKRKIGKVGYVFGPTKQPYISIRLLKSANRDEIAKNCGEKLFVSKQNSKKSRKRRMRPRQKK